MNVNLIKLNSVNDVVNFVQEANKVKGDVIVGKKNCAIDGSSLIGMSALDISKPILVRYPEEATDFDEFIRQFEIEITQSIC